MRSLRFRLLTAAAVSISLGLVAAGFGLVTLFERHVERRLEVELETDLRQLMARIEVARNGRIHVVSDLADPRFEEPLSGLYWQIQDDERSTLLRSRSLWDARLDLPQDVLGLGVVHHHTLDGPAGQSLMVRERQIILRPQTEARRLRVAVAIDRQDLGRARQAFSTDMLPYLSLLAFALILASWIQVRMGLAPLHRIRRGIAAIRNDTTQRLSDTFPDEVEPLVDEINQLLDERDAAVDKARAWTADLAPGLKTPLTTLNADAQRLRSAGQIEMADNLDQLARSMQQRVDRELIRARLRAAGAATARHSQLSAVVDGVVQTLRRTPMGEGLDWHIDVPADLVLPPPKDDLTELVGNLLDNAAKWARHTVGVTSEDSLPVRLVIEDDGPGVPDDKLAVLCVRGLRLDEQTAGSGLGLAIVSDIVEAYGGELSFSRSELGGMKVCLTFYLQAPSVQ